MKFWIDRKYPWRIWFGKNYHKGKYNWIDLHPGKESLKIERRFRDGGVYDIFIHGIFADYRLTGTRKEDFRLATFEFKKWPIPLKN